MARRIGDDEFPPRRREIAIGDVDGDALLALGLKPIDQQSKIQRAAGAASRTLGIVLRRLELILVDLSRIVEQPADQRALAVIHAAAGEKAKQPAMLLRIEPGFQPRFRVLAGGFDQAQMLHQK